MVRFLYPETLTRVPVTRIGILIVDRRPSFNAPPACIVLGRTVDEILRPPQNHPGQVPVVGVFHVIRTRMDRAAVSVNGSNGPPARYLGIPESDVIAVDGIHALGCPTDATCFGIPDYNNSGSGPPSLY